MPARVLHLVSVGSPPLGLLKDLEEPLQTQLGMTIVLSKTQLQTPSYAFNKDRNQYHCNAIMRRLVPMLEPGLHFVMGVVDVDLFVPDSSFVFGEADRESRIGLVSTARLRMGSTSDGLKRRMQVESVHQAGHLVGLSYCDDPRCVMFMATNASDCDRKNIALCNVCRNELAKLNR